MVSMLSRPHGGDEIATAVIPDQRTLSRRVVETAIRGYHAGAKRYNWSRCLYNG
jgi:hypothetical protein